MTYHGMHESFSILSDWCESVEEILAASDNGITVSADLVRMDERDLRRLVELGWEVNYDCNYLHLSV